MRFQSNLSILVILAGVIGLWAPIHLVNKIALISFSPQAVALTRWAGVSIILWSLLAMKKFRSLLGIKYEDLYRSRAAILIGFIFLGPGHTLGSYAYQHTTSIEASVLATSGPIWTTLMAFIFLREKIYFVRGIAIFLGIVGAYIITMGMGIPEFNSSSLIGNAIFLIYILFESFALIYAKKFLGNVHGITIVAWQAVGTMIFLFVSSLIFPNYCPLKCHQLDTSSILAMSYLILVAGIFCFTLWYIIAQKAPISLMAVTGGIEPLIGTLLGATFLKEQITPQIGIGMLFVIASIMIGSVGSKKSSLNP